MCSNTYSWRDFGRDAEFVVANYLKSKGWSVSISRSSRGAADIIAKKDSNTLCVQVKASMKSPHITSEEIGRLKIFAASIDGIPVFASFQPWTSNDGLGAPIGSYMIFFYSLDDWKAIKV